MSQVILIFNAAINKLMKFRNFLSIAVSHKLILGMDECTNTNII